MSEDNKQDTAAVVESNDVTVEADPIESQAREQGWVSKEEWVEGGRSEAEWRPAKEFVERGEIFKSLHQVKRELKQEKAAREALQKHHQYVYEKAYQKAMADLKAERRAAMREEDFDKLEKVEDEMARLQAERQAEAQAFAAQQQVVQAQGVSPEFNAWVEKNQWYATDAEMREFAEAVGMIYMNKNPGFNPQDVLKHVEAKVRKQYSEKFGVRKAAPNAVAGVDRTSQRKSSGTDLVLDEMEESIMKTLVDSGTMTKEEYIKELKQAKGIK